LLIELRLALEQRRRREQFAAFASFGLQKGFEDRKSFRPSCGHQVAALQDIDAGLRGRLHPYVP
jgi:hypothetical protein